MGLNRGWHFGPGWSVYRFALRGGRWVWALAGVLFAPGNADAFVFRTAWWEAVPGLSFLQFPYRFLGIAPLGALPAAALAVDVWPARWRWLLGVALVAALSIVFIPYLFPAHTQIIHPVQSVKALSAEDTRLVEQTSRLWGMTTSNEFLVKGANLEVITGEMPEPSATRPTWRTPHEASGESLCADRTSAAAFALSPRLERGAAGCPDAEGRTAGCRCRNYATLAGPRQFDWEGTVAQRWGERMSLVGLLASVAGVLFLALRNRGKFWGVGERRKGNGERGP